MAMQPISWLREGNVHLLWAPAYACPQQNVVAYATDDAWLELIIPEPCHLQVCLFATFCQSSEPQDKQEFSYNSFNPGRDFGPLDLCATVTYCRWVDALIQTHTQNALVHITTERPECWSNTITLCGAYLVLAKAWKSLEENFDLKRWLAKPAGATSCEKIGHALLPLAKLATGLLPAISFTVLGFCALTHALYAVQASPQHLWPKTFWSSSQRLITQDLGEGPPADSLEHILLFLGVLFFSIFMMNVFIGVINDQYSAEKTKAPLAFQSLRAKSCLTHLLRMSVIRCDILTARAGAALASLCVLTAVWLQLAALHFNLQLPGCWQFFAFLFLQLLTFWGSFQCRGNQYPWSTFTRQEKLRRFLWICEPRDYGKCEEETVTKCFARSTPRAVLTSQSLPFIRSVSDLEPDFQLSVLDVLQGLQHVRDLGWLDYRTYPVEVHASMLQPEHGDMTWLLQDRGDGAIAMASPWVLPVDGEKLPVCTPEALVPYFMQNKVAIIIQCNHPQAEEKGDRQQLLSYNPKLFECAGIRHVMGAPKALSALSPSEQLRLLPRRELRFWALDLGIERQQTEGKPEDEIIPMILQARGHVVAEHASQAFRPPDPATLHLRDVVCSSLLPGEENAWAELQKYLRMLCKEESNGWLEVAQLVEKLRQLPSGAGPPPDTSPAAQLSSADQAELARAAEVSKHKDEETWLGSKNRRIERSCSESCSSSMPSKVTAAS
eukprot:g28929.t1